MIFLHDRKGDTVSTARPYQNHGLNLDPNPLMRPWEWGEEAKTGYTYRTKLQRMNCPSCGEFIYVDELVHEMKKFGGWKNYCLNCRPDLVPAIITT